jgi:hypothetical protein
MIRWAILWNYEKESGKETDLHDSLDQRNIELI